MQPYNDGYPGQPKPEQQSFYSPQQQPPMQQFTPPQMPYPSQQYQPMQGQQFAPMQTIPAQPFMMQQAVNVNVSTGKQRGFLSRVIYFCFIGWWAGFLWLNIGYALCLTVIGLPFGLAMLNRLPRVLTLRPSSANTTNVNVTTTAMAQSGLQGAAPVMMQTVNVNVNVGNTQHNFLLRVIYFICIGCWAGYCWALIGYACCMSVVLLPVGLMMLNRLPAVITLRKN